MFSVVIPLYNKEKEIQKTLESVLNQTFPDFEIVIINDGSKDNSVAVVNGIKDDRIRLIDKPNGGVSSARNRGIEEARYEWIAFLDADDLWEPNKLEKIALVINENPAVSWIFSAFKVIQGNEVQIRSYSSGGFLDDVLNDLDKGLRIQTSSMVVRKKFFHDEHKLFFKLGINNSEDREVWYRLCFRFPHPYYIQQPLSSYVIDESGNSLIGNANNFAFLGLSERLSDDYGLLTAERKKTFITFINRFNRQGCWLIWSKGGWNSNFKGFVTQSDEVTMKVFSAFSPRFRKFIVKVVRKLGAF